MRVAHTSGAEESSRESVDRGVTEEQFEHAIREVSASEQPMGAPNMPFRAPAKK